MESPRVRAAKTLTVRRGATATHDRARGRVMSVRVETATPADPPARVSIARDVTTGHAPSVGAVIPLIARSETVNGRVVTATPVRIVLVGTVPSRARSVLASTVVSRARSVRVETVVSRAPIVLAARVLSRVRSVRVARARTGTARVTVVPAPEHLGDSIVRTAAQRVLRRTSGNAVLRSPRT